MATAMPLVAPQRPRPRSDASQPLRMWPYAIDYRVEPDTYRVSAGDPNTEHLARQPAILLWGVDDTGARVVTRIYGFLPYMYCGAPEAWAHRDPSAGELERLRFALNDAVEAKCARDSKFFHPRGMDYVHSVEFQRRQPMVNYQANKAPVLKVTLTTPKLVPKMRACLWNKNTTNEDDLPDDPVVFELDDVLRVPVENAHYDSESGDRLESPAKQHCRRVKAMLPAMAKMPENELYECSLGFCERFLIDCKIELCEWCELPAQSYLVLPNDVDRMGNPNVLFVGAMHTAIRTLSDTESASLSAPGFYEAGFDIEVANTVHTNNKADFPVAARPNDEVLCICMAMHRNGEAAELEQRERAKCEEEGLSMKDPDQKKVMLKRLQLASLRGGWYEVFYQGACDEDAVRQRRNDKPVYFFRADNERDLILLWMRRMLEFGPEFGQGWNINNFDLPYINERLNLHYAEDAKMMRNVAPNVGVLWERGKNEQWRCVASQFESRQSGKRGGYDMKWSGCVWVDMMQRVVKGFKLRSYRLDNVAQLFLGEKKEDMDPALITPKWRSGPAGAAEVAHYCCWDAELPWRISTTKQITSGLLQMARVTRVQPESLITRGESIKAYVQIVTMANSMDYIVNHHQMPPPDPDEKGRGKAKFKGAVVIEPRRGFYTSPVITLDFSSLYPSLMISHNLCHSTYVPPECLHLVPESIRFKTPAGHWFVRHDVRPGICPAVARRLLRWRKEVRVQAEVALAAGDYARFAVLDGRQLQIKIVANSLYGFTGSDAKLPCFAVSESITAYGREEIMAVKKLIEEQFPGCIVIYGDTDSVMVLTPAGTTMEQAHELAKAMTKMINDRYKADPNSIMSMAFEKVYFPYLLVNKKRYAGMYWTKIDTPDKMDTKGMENVRRDNAPVTSRTVDAMLKALLQDQDVEKAKRIAKDTLKAVLTRTLPFEDFVISNAFSREAKNYKTKKAHIEVNTRVAERTPGREKHEGDRIDYVITTRTIKGATYQKAEDPTFARQHNVPLDVHWYVENQLRKPITRLLKAVMTKEQINSEIFNGPHMNVRKAVVPRSDEGIGRFMQAGQKRSVDTLAEQFEHDLARLKPEANDHAQQQQEGSAASTPLPSSKAKKAKKTPTKPKAKAKAKTKAKSKTRSTAAASTPVDDDNLVRPLTNKRSADESSATDMVIGDDKANALNEIATVQPAKRAALASLFAPDVTTSSSSSPPKKKAAARALSSETSAQRTKRLKDESEKASKASAAKKPTPLQAYLLSTKPVVSP